MRTPPAPAKAAGWRLLTSCNPPKDFPIPCLVLHWVATGREKTGRGAPFLTSARCNRGLSYWMLCTQVRAPGGRYAETKAYLLFEVANGILISIGEEVKDAVFDVVLFEVVHQVGAVALWGDGAGVRRQGAARGGEDRRPAEDQRSWRESEGFVGVCSGPD